MSSGDVGWGVGVYRSHVTVKLLELCPPQRQRGAVCLGANSAPAALDSAPQRPSDTFNITNRTFTRTFSRTFRIIIGTAELSTGPSR